MIEHLKLIGAFIFALSWIFWFCWFLDTGMSHDNPTKRPRLSCFPAAFRGLKTIMIAVGILGAIVVVGGGGAWLFVQSIFYLISWFR